MNKQTKPQKKANDKQTQVIRNNSISKFCKYIHTHKHSFQVVIIHFKMNIFYITQQ